MRVRLQFAQLTAEGLKTGLYLAMAAIGLSLIFGTTGLVNFAHAELVTWGMLSTSVSPPLSLVVLRQRVVATRAQCLNCPPDLPREFPVVKPGKPTW